MPPRCVDASVVLSWLFEEGIAAIDDFWASLRNDDELVAPMLLLPECSSNIHTKVYRGILRPEQGWKLLDRLTNIPFRVSVMPEQCRLAAEIAMRTRRSKSYDMQYIAVAELEGIELVTADRGMRQAAVERKIPVRLLQ